MTKKTTTDISADTRRQKVASDVAEFLSSGAKISHIPNGVTAYDGQGRTSSALATSKNRAAARPTPSTDGAAPKTSTT